MLEKKSNKPGKQKLSRCNVKRKKAKKAEVVDAEDAQRPMCDGLWSQSLPGEDWIECLECEQWFHEECCSSATPVSVTCDLCVTKSSKMIFNAFL